MEKSKLFRQATVKRTQHHQTSFTTNTKGISLGRKHKRRKRPAESKLKTIKKTVIGSSVQFNSVAQSCPTLCDPMDCSMPGLPGSGSYILMNTLNVNGLKASTKRHRLAGWMKIYTCMLFYESHHSAWPSQIGMQLFYIVKLIMFALWFATVTFIFFLDIDCENW